MFWGGHKSKWQLGWNDTCQPVLLKPWCPGPQMPFLLPTVTGPSHFYTKSSCHRIDRNLGNRVDNRLHIILETWQHPRLLFQAAFRTLQSLSFHLPSNWAMQFVKHCELYGATRVTAPGPPTTTDLLLLLLPSLLNENVLLFSQVKILWKHRWLKYWCYMT